MSHPSAFAFRAYGVSECRRRMDGGLEFHSDDIHCVSEWGFEFRPDTCTRPSTLLTGSARCTSLAIHIVSRCCQETVTKRNQHDLERELRLPQPPDYVDLPRDMPHPIQPFIILESCELPKQSFQPTISSRYWRFSVSSTWLKAAFVFVRKREDRHVSVRC